MAHQSGRKYEEDAQKRWHKSKGLCQGGTSIANLGQEVQGTSEDAQKRCHKSKGVCQGGALIVNLGQAVRGSLPTQIETNEIDAQKGRHKPKGVKVSHQSGRKYEEIYTNSRPMK